MAMKTFTGTRAPSVPGDSKQLSSWHLSAGGVALIVNFCDATSATPLFQVQVPVNSSASQAYPKAIVAPNYWHVEVVSGTLNRGAIDL